MNTIKVGTRKSKLAQIQADQVLASLRAQFPQVTFEKVLMETKGDLDRKTDLVQMGGQGVFVKAIQEALLADEIQMAVHSCKDLPSVEPTGLTIGAFWQRAAVGDSLILAAPYQSLADLPQNAVVGTSSRRRRFQMAKVRPDLDLQALRGNIDTRIEKLIAGKYDAILMAQAGIDRYGLPLAENHLTAYPLPTEEFVPAVGQGIIAVECVAGSVAAELLKAIDNPEVRLAATCERSFLAVFGLGCNVPLAGFAYLEDEKIHFSGQLGDEKNAAAITIQQVEKLGITPLATAARVGEQVAEKIKAKADFLPE